MIINNSQILFIHPFYSVFQNSYDSVFKAKIDLERTHNSSGIDELFIQITIEGKDALGDCFLHRLVKDCCFKRQRKGERDWVSESCSREGNQPSKALKWRHI